MSAIGGYLRRDGLLLLGSLVLGVIVWIYVNDELTETRKVQVRMQLKVPEGMELVSGPLTSVEATLRGPRGRMASLDPLSLLVRYEIPPEASGTLPVTLGEKDFVRLPPGVQVAAMPEGLTITVERQVQKTVDVRPQVVGQPAPDFRIVTFQARPSKVQIRGTRERVEKLEAVSTEKIDVDGERRKVEKLVRIATPEGVHCSVPVLVEVEISRELTPRAVPNIQVLVLAPPGFDRRVQLEEPTISLQVLCDPQQVAVVDPRSILAMIDVSHLADAEAGNYELPVKVQLPPGLSLAAGAKLPRVLVRLGR